MLKIKRFALFTALTAGTFLFHACSSEPEREDLHFIVAGHVCGGVTDTTGGLYKPFESYLLEKSKDTTLDFAVFTGDIVFESNEHSWSLIDLALKKIKQPVYFAPGNQDLRDRALYEKRYGKGDQYFEKGNNLFIIWEVLANGWNVSDAQLDEFIKLTEERKYDNVFIFTHQVIWQNELITPQIVLNDTEGKAEVLSFYPSTIQALSQNETPVYLFAGDVGGAPVGSELTVNQYKNVRLIASGMGGGKWDNVIDVTVKDGKTTISVNYFNGNKPLVITDQYLPITF